MIPLLPFGRATGLSSESDEALALIDEASRTPLLSETEERKLTKELTDLRLLIKTAEQHLADHPNDLDMQAYVAKLRQSYLSVRNHIFSSNILLVMSIANRRTRLDFMDRFQYGCMGLWHSLTKFDYYAGKRLSTYATYWIVQYIRRGADQDETTIRIPVHTRDILKRLAHANNEFISKHHRSPTLDELCAISGQSLFRIRQALISAEQPISLFYETQSWDDGGGMVMDVIPGSSDLEGDYIEHERREEIIAVMRSILADMRAYVDERGRSFARHADILQLLFYIDEIPPEGDDGKPVFCRTLEEVGRMIEPKITRERTRQLKYQAFFWIRANYPDAIDVLKES